MQECGHFLLSGYGVKLYGQERLRLLVVNLNLQATLWTRHKRNAGLDAGSMRSIAYTVLAFSLRK